MTLILAATGPDGTFVGADSRVSDDYSYSDTTDKLTPIHDYVVGVAGSSRVGQLIHYQPESFGPIASAADVFAFSRQLRQLLHEDHNLKTGSETDPRFSLLLATTAGVFCLHRNYQFHWHEAWAVGSGDDFGMGYFRASAAMTDTALRIRTSIEATAQYVPSVGGPVSIRKAGLPTTGDDGPASLPA